MLVKSKHFATFLIGFSEYQIYKIFEIGLFYGGENLVAKIIL